jgi:hypothetical protein
VSPESDIANIGPRERRKRLIFGVALFGVSGVIAAVLLGDGIWRGWRALLFLPLFGGALGVFQARERT